MSLYEYNLRKRQLQNTIERNQREIDNLKKNYSKQINDMEYKANMLKDNLESECKEKINIFSNIIYEWKFIHYNKK